METRKPDFFIVGAPKCGTTSMNNWLHSHPAIFMAEKEPHYFNTDHANRKITQLPTYRNLFKSVTDAHQVVGETSVRYLYSTEAIRNILSYNEAAVFIVMLRNPLEMVYSWHNQVYFSGLEDIKDFQTAWRLQSKRKLGKQIPPRCPEAKMLQYGEVCQLGKQLQRLYEQVPAERVHVVLFDDLTENPAAAYRSVLKFLHVPDDKKQDFIRYNPAKTYYSYQFNLLLFWLGRLKKKLAISKSFGVLEWLRAHNKRIHKRSPLPKAMKQTLTQYFYDDIKLLESLIHVDLTHWLE